MHAILRCLQCGIRLCLQLGKDLDVISCDNEQQYLSSLKVRPATIDINLDLVGRRGVQQLLWRMKHPEEPSRIDVLVRPRIVLPQS